MFFETQNYNTYLGVDRSGRLGGDILLPIENQSSSIPDNFFLDFGFPPVSTGHCWLKLSKDYLMLIDGGYETGNATSYMMNFESVRILKRIVCSDRIVLLIRSTIPENHNTKSADYSTSFSCMLKESFE